MTICCLPLSYTPSTMIAQALRRHASRRSLPRDFGVSYTCGGAVESPVVTLQREASFWYRTGRPDFHVAEGGLIGMLQRRVSCASAHYIPSQAFSFPLLFPPSDTITFRDKPYMSKWKNMIWEFALMTELMLPTSCEHITASRCAQHCRGIQTLMLNTYYLERMRLVEEWVCTRESAFRIDRGNLPEHRVSLRGRSTGSMLPVKSPLQSTYCSVQAYIFTNTLSIREIKTAFESSMSILPPFHLTVWV